MQVFLKLFQTGCWQLSHKRDSQWRPLRRDWHVWVSPTGKETWISSQSASPITIPWVSTLGTRSLSSLYTSSVTSSGNAWEMGPATEHSFLPCFCLAVPLHGVCCLCEQRHIGHVTLPPARCCQHCHSRPQAPSGCPSCHDPPRLAIFTLLFQTQEKPFLISMYLTGSFHNRPWEAPKQQASLSLDKQAELCAHRRPGSAMAQDSPIANPWEQPLLGQFKTFSTFSLV